MNELSNLNGHTYYVCISIEKDNGSRQFYHFTIEELIILYTHCSANERTFYEVILPTNVVKAYFDFEYNIDDNPDIQNHNIGTICCLKLFHHVLNFFEEISFDDENYINNVLKQFLVLEAKYTISELITLLSPYVTILCTQCTKCCLRNSCINVAEIAHLIILDKYNQWTLAIDLSVYSHNQQFRLFDCTKRGKNNFLRQSTHLPFNNKSDISSLKY